MRRIVLAGVAIAALFATAPVAGSPAAVGSPGHRSPGSCPDPGTAGARVPDGAVGTDPDSLSSEQVKALDHALQRRLRALSPAQRAAAHRGAAPVTIDVFWHVITRNDGSGGVADARIRRQVRVLNESYAGKTAKAASATRFSFETRTILRTANSDWYDWANPERNLSDDNQAKRALHRGTRADLNIYVTNLRGLLGYASYPGGPLAKDGVVVLKATLPGGRAVGYRQGDTLTHEVGHWLGLYHTFQGGCTKPGDHVRDTPRQRAGNNIYTCNTRFNTCDAAGRDPVRNFMNYVGDACMNRFTSGQATRMSQVWRAFRAPSTQ